jgi:hypothetical protein
MRLRVAVRAAIADDQQCVVGVGGMAQGREYDAAGDDSRQDQGRLAQLLFFLDDLAPSLFGKPLLNR